MLSLGYSLIGHSRGVLRVGHFIAEYSILVFLPPPCFTLSINSVKRPLFEHSKETDDFGSTLQNDYVYNFSSTCRREKDEMLKLMVMIMISWLTIQVVMVDVDADADG